LQPTPVYESYNVCQWRLKQVSLKLEIKICNTTCQGLHPHKLHITFSTWYLVLQQVLIL
jgi:hypothetical protein